MGSNVVKVTVSVPEDLVIMADKVAKERKTSRSKVVSSCLEQLAKQRFLADLEEGYRAMAKINEQHAADTYQAQSEVVADW